MKTIIEIAQDRGSKATTKTGAWKYLMAHLPKPSAACAPGNSLFRDTGRWGGRKKADWLRSQDESRADKIARRLGAWSHQCAEALACELSGISALRDKLVADWPYRQSQSSWAGGAHSVDVILSDAPACEGGSKRVWSSNGKWSGTNSFAKLHITGRAIQAGVLIGGLITLDAIPVGRREWKAVWVAQGRGFSLYPRTGWIIRGFHSTAPTLEGARKQAWKAREESLAARLRERVLSKKAKIDYAQVWVTANDSLCAGNCKPGTLVAEQRIREKVGAVGEIGAIRADALLEIRDDMFSRRAIAWAATRNQA